MLPTSFGHPIPSAPDTFSRVRGGDSVKLRKRDVICDSSRIDTLLAVPL